MVRHDDDDRLINESRSETGTTWPAGMDFNNTYTLDKAGNRSSVIRSGNTFGYSYFGREANDELESGDGYTVTGYDDDGNPESVGLPSGATATFTFNQENEVTKIALSSGVTDVFTYDGDGKRQTNAVTQSGTTNTSTYGYDGSEIVDTIVNSASQTYRLPGVGEYSASGGQMYIYSDQHGNNAIELNYGYINPGKYDYDGYGIESTSAAPPSNTSSFKYAGEHGYVTDAETGLVLCGSRYYIPGVGRFLNQDPIGQQGGINLYEYCGDNPLNLVDPGGHQGVDLNKVFEQELGTPDSWAAGAKKALQPMTDSYNSWWSGLDVGFGFILGLGPTTNQYGPDSFETMMVRQSAIGSTIDACLAAHSWLQVPGHRYRHAGIKSLPAYLNTISQPWNGIQRNLVGLTTTSSATMATWMFMSEMT
jgi:RHS repeat-associated protein